MRRRFWAPLLCVALALATTAPMTPSAAGAAAADPEEEKLALEIEKLEQDTGAWRFAGIAGVIVTLVVSGIGATRYLRDRKEEHKLRIEADIAGNLTSLQEAPESQGSASGRAVAALVHLTGLTSLKQTDAARKDQVTATLTAIVDRDLPDFDTPARAYFPVICAEHWEPYAERLAEHPSACRAILRRYRASLSRIRADNPEYMNKVSRVDEAYAADSVPITEADRLLFAAVADGYAAHVARIVDTTARETEIEEFGTIVNAKLRDQLLRSSGG